MCTGGSAAATASGVYDLRHLEKIQYDPLTGETVCLCCARVISIENETVQTAKADKYTKKIQHGTPLTQIHDRGLNTILGPDRDFEGRKIAEPDRIYRLKKWQARVATSGKKEQRLYGMLQSHNSTLAYLGIPKPIAESSIGIMRKIIQKDLLKHTPRKYVSAVAIYWAYKQHDVAFSVKQMIVRLQLHGSRFLSHCLDVDEKLHLKTDSKKDPILAAIHAVSDELRIHARTRTDAAKLLSLARKTTPEIGSRLPNGIAAAIIYEAQGPQKRYILADLAEAAHTSEPTIRLNRILLAPALEKFNEVNRLKTAITQYREANQ
jgi:transcription initiation factor TFIIIB Brf1 subunit/transcription initiation factor TFIIB